MYSTESNMPQQYKQLNKQGLASVPYSGILQPISTAGPFSLQNALKRLIKLFQE